MKRREKFHFDKYYVCDVKKNVPTLASPKDAIYWVDNIYVEVLRSSVFKSMRADYKYVKFNRFSWFITADAIIFDTTNTTVKSELSLLGVHFFKNQPAYYVWNADKQRPDPTALSNDHLQEIFILDIKSQPNLCIFTRNGKSFP
ncbi:hypothetical protein AVEN_9579-1 [Araneus ventricosus]|uniref:Uncharacterized protein n=1 Tax=Araneus ventricosus TaxID=182803 RepID=A0A4Y2H8N6_ARAVE|nr:hypothetical protein AVEN_9579-1 [Araneus ventricosus]